MKYIIKWVNKNTGAKSQGSPISEESAKAQAKWANSKFPHIDHHCEPFKPLTIQ